jgi:putative ABC transport system ATP-binding protein
MALKHVDLQIDRGEFVAVIGKSGSGKSTLINVLTGIDRPTSGEVLVGDTAVHTLKEGQMAVWRGHTVGVIFQFFQLLPTLSVIENVMLPMDFCNLYTPRERRERALHLLAQVEMTEHAHKLPTAISGGQQQRVAIARALANDPPILVADEPTGNLDSRTAEAVFHLFETLVADGKTIVMVTHDTDLAQRVGRAVLVADGQIVDEIENRKLLANNRQPSTVPLEVWSMEHEAREQNGMSVVAAQRSISHPASHSGITQPLNEMPSEQRPTNHDAQPMLDDEERSPFVTRRLSNHEVPYA